MDGARLANAAAALGVSLADASARVGVDILSFGGTKSGLLGAEAVVFLNEDLADGFDFIRKQTLQLASKMRYLSVQFEALFTDDLWLRSATHANEMATQLSEALAPIPNITISQKVESNVVFAKLPAQSGARLRKHYAFYAAPDGAAEEARWMCSWDTTVSDVERFVETLNWCLARTACGAGS
jgi:threonine aldolase